MHRVFEIKPEVCDLVSCSSSVYIRRDKTERPDEVGVVIIPVVYPSHSLYPLSPFTSSLR